MLNFIGIMSPIILKINQIIGGSRTSTGNMWHGVGPCILKGARRLILLYQLVGPWYVDALDVIVPEILRVTLRVALLDDVRERGHLVVAAVRAILDLVEVGEYFIIPLETVLVHGLQAVWSWLFQHRQWFAWAGGLLLQVMNVLIRAFAHILIILLILLFWFFLRSELRYFFLDEIW